MHGRVCQVDERKKKGHRRLMFRPPSRVISSVHTSCSSSLSISSSTSFSKVISIRKVLFFMPFVLSNSIDEGLISCLSIFDWL